MWKDIFKYVDYKTIIATVVGGALLAIAASFINMRIEINKSQHQINELKSIAKRLENSLEKLEKTYKENLKSLRIEFEKHIAQLEEGNLTMAENLDIFCERTREH